MKKIFSGIWPVTVSLIFLMSGDLASAAENSKPEMRTIAKGTFSGIQEPSELVITNKTQWREVWAKSSKRVPPEPTPEIDFSKESILLVSMGKKNSGGYAVTIDSVERKGEIIIARVIRKSPPEGAITIQALTAPFHIVA